jgi:hypothetical protein
MAPNCLPHQVKSKEKKEEIDWRSLMASDGL